jgi:hypothetical protein
VAAREEGAEDVEDAEDVGAAQVGEGIERIVHPCML